MKKLLPCLSAFLISSGAHAQFYNNAPLINTGTAISDFGTQWINAAGGSYMGSNLATFLHYGPSTATFINDGSYDAGPAGSDEFLGPNGTAGAQEIGGTVRPRFNSLAFNNGPGQAIRITNLNGIAVAHQLVMTSGIVSTVRSRADTGAILIAGNASLSATVGNTLHVNGYVSRAGGGIFQFPVGDGSSSCSLRSNGGAQTGDTLAVAYVSGSPDRPGLDPTGGPHSRSALSTAGTPGTTRLTSVSPVGFWDWVPVSGTSTISVLVQIPDMSGPGGYTSPADMRVVGFNRSTGVWDNLGGSTGATSNAAGTFMSGTVPDMAGYSALGIGSVGMAAPLPIGLLSFDGRAAGCRTELEWTIGRAAPPTAFTIFRSGDGTIWSAIGELPAVSGQDKFRFTDHDPRRGTNFYRLQTLEHSGEQAYSRVLSINPDCGQLPAIVVSPVPFSDLLRIEGIPSRTTIRVFDAAGKTVWTGMAEAHATIMTSTWIPGAYSVQMLQDGNEIAVRNIMKR